MSWWGLAFFLNISTPQTISFWSNLDVKKLPPCSSVTNFLNTFWSLLHCFSSFAWKESVRWTVERNILQGFFFLTLHRDGENTAPAPSCSGRRWCPCPAGWRVPAAAVREIYVSTTVHHEGKPPHALTTSPAFFTANGRLSSPVPMFPFRMWIRVWKALKLRHKHKSKSCHSSSLCSLCLDSATHVVPDCSPNRS